jgi:non-heme chloroperoxidase
LRGQSLIVQPEGEMTCRDFVRATVAALAIGGALSTLAMADEIKRASANGTELAYVELGQGEPVVFVHGGLQDYRMWAVHLPKFRWSLPRRSV